MDCNPSRPGSSRQARGLGRREERGQGVVEGRGGGGGVKERWGSEWIKLKGYWWKRGKEIRLRRFRSSRNIALPTDYHTINIRQKIGLQRKRGLLLRIPKDGSTEDLGDACPNGVSGPEIFGYFPRIFVMILVSLLNVFGFLFIDVIITFF